MFALPAPVAALVAAINGGDTRALMTLLARDAVVEDWGSVYASRAEIEDWNKRELIGAKGKLTVTGARTKGDTVVLDTDWVSSFFSGAGRFTLTLADGKIKRWVISAP